MSAVNESLNAWLAEIAKPDPIRAKDFLGYFPSDALRDEYTDHISQRSELEVRNLLRSLLVPQGAIGKDKIMAELLRQSGREPESEYERRLQSWTMGGKRFTPWEGMTWVLDLLPWQPNEAIQVIDAYLYAHAQELPDAWIWALGDAASVIRSYYLGLPSTEEEAVTMLLGLSSRDFEHLVDEFYHELGYTTELTREQKDGGRDIIAIREDGGHTSNLRIECKNSQLKVGVVVARALYGVIEDERADKGVLIGTSGFTKGEKSATEFAARNSRLELLPGSELVERLSRTFGRHWVRDLDRLIRNSKLRYSETLAAQSVDTAG